MSEAECKQWILETIDSLRSRKARPDLERICKMVQRRHGLAPSRTRRQLDRLLRSRTVLRVSYKGSHSYRIAAQWQPGTGHRQGRDQPQEQPRTVLTRARLQQQQRQQQQQLRRPGGRRTMPPEAGTSSERKKTRKSKEADSTDGEESDEDASIEDQDLGGQAFDEEPNTVQFITDSVSDDHDSEENPVRSSKGCPTDELAEELSAGKLAETSSDVEQSSLRYPTVECKDVVDAEMKLNVDDLKTIQEQLSSNNARDVGCSEEPAPLQEDCSEEYSQEICTSQGESEPEPVTNEQQGPELSDSTEGSKQMEDIQNDECDQLTCPQGVAKMAEDPPLSKDCSSIDADNCLDTMLLDQTPAVNPNSKLEAVEKAADLSTDPRDSVPEVGGASCLLTPSASPIDMVPEEHSSTDRQLMEKNGKPVDPTEWSIADVVNYFKEAGFPEQAAAFEDQEIDGKSLLLMKRNDVLTGLAIKLGPALKIYEYHIKVLQLHHFNNEAPSS
ncbi:lethal(3)malignant brain tumor-like protein 3 isoform X2 [Stegostoma tigrinum]|uniref:lethal(3)malignant brain tumor-like protein 3 isoform X2 n=1 Tax=Stegostoma tigrinum TaxID=3053191 RepID=UPI00202B22FB|nr:lethal(3)malignant brain tumor-like protein 3 isoform X2 [Stegostoma tigrinum]